MAALPVIAGSRDLHQSPLTSKLMTSSFPQLLPSRARRTVSGGSEPARPVCGRRSAAARNRKRVAIRCHGDEQEVTTAAARAGRLVSSSREILMEKTFVADADASHIAFHLERFHNAVSISKALTMDIRERADEQLRFLLPRVAKLGIRVGLKVIGSVRVGSAFDNTQVIDPNDVDVLVIFDAFQAKTVMTSPGYVTIPLVSHVMRDGAEPPLADAAAAKLTSRNDPWRYGRSRDRQYLSPVAVARTVHGLVERALRGGPGAGAGADEGSDQRVNVGGPGGYHLLPFGMEADRAPITVLVGSLRINVSPACAVSDNPGDVTYVVARPYSHDVDPNSDSLWRLSTAERELRIFDTVDRTDRGSHRKSFRILKALVRVEPALSGLSSYHVKTAAMHAFDAAVDATPRWQRQSVEEAFVALLAELDARLTAGRLPHFFFRRRDLFDFVPARTLERWRTRIHFLAENGRELVRVLRRRTEEVLAQRAADIR